MTAWQPPPPKLQGLLQIITQPPEAGTSSVLTKNKCLSMVFVFLAASLFRRPSLRNSFVGLITSSSPTIS